MTARIRCPELKKAGGDWSRVYLSKINYVRASKTIEKRPGEYYATNLTNREYQYNDRSGVVLRQH
jgi:hypothetical protein